MSPHQLARTEAEIDARIEQWHTGDYPCNLHEFLGWSREEYARWVETRHIPTEPVLITSAEANEIADALLSGCFALTEVEHSTVAGSLEHTSAVNTGKRLRDAMVILESAINRYAPATEPPTITTFI